MKPATAAEIPGSAGSIREGTTLYYSLLFTEPSLRQRLLQRLEVIQTIASALNGVGEPTVAERKLHWWREDIDLLFQAKARHPALGAAEDDLAGSDTVRAALRDILAVAGEEHMTAARTEQEFEERLIRDYNARIRLFLHPSGSPSSNGAPSTLPVTDSLASGLAGVDRLLKLPYLLHRGYAVFSDEHYAQHDLDVAMLRRQVRVAGEQPTANRLRDPEVSKRTRALLFDAIGSSQRKLAAALLHPVIDTAEHPAVLSVLTLAALRERQCRLWLKGNPRLLVERQSLTPLRKFFIAWRCHRRFR